MGARLIDIEWPEFGICPKPDGPDSSEFAARITAAREATAERSLSHLLVYGDREHFSNLYYLCGLDPRFEDAVLILGLDATPLLLLGNECLGCVSVSPLHAAGLLRPCL